jgi:rubrerythrin
MNYAHDYYQHVADHISDDEAARLARQFAAEELTHVAQLKRLISAVPESGVHHREDDDDPHMPE